MQNATFVPISLQALEVIIY